MNNYAQLISGHFRCKTRTQTRHMKLKTVSTELYKLATVGLCVT